MYFSFDSALRYLLFLSGTSTIFLVFSVILFYQAYKHRTSRSKWLAFYIMICQVVAMLVMIKNAISGTDISSIFDNVLETGPLLSAFILYIPLLCFMVEIKCQKWFNKKRFFLFFGPILILALCSVFFVGSETQLGSIQDFLENLDKPDVVYRFVLVLLNPIYAVVTIIVVPHNWKNCGVSKLLLVHLELLVLILTFLFIFSIGFYIKWVMVVHLVSLLALNLMIVYIEVSANLPARERPIMHDIEKSELSKHPFFDNPDIWSNPEMTATQLVRLMGTNSKYLTKELREYGFSSYCDMINRKRVEYIYRELRESDGSDCNCIVHLMFDAGFRSRSNASSVFKRIVGCSPTEYLERFRKNNE